MIERAIFSDEAGRRWEVQILFGHPALPERGIWGARYTCVDDPAEPVRVGYVQEWALSEPDAELLLEMLAESEPGTPIG